MAWNYKWNISFRSYLGYSYYLSILEDGYQGSMITLQGAANPFETQEDSDADAFKPIRGQTGKINIVTDNPTLLQTLIPDNDTQRRVELRKNGVVVWYGFLSSAAYSQPMENSFSKVTIPVKSILSTLNSVEFDGYYGTTETVGDAIYHIFLKAGFELSTSLSDHYRRMWFQTELNEENDYLTSMICLSRFYNIETYSDNNGTYQRVKAMSCYDVLASILKLFGWCIREYNGDFYVVSNVKQVVYSSTFTCRMYDFINHVFANTKTGSKVAISDFESYIASDDSKVTFNAGAKDVTVSLSIADDAAIDTGSPETPYSTNPMYGGEILDGDGEVKGVTYAQGIDNPTTQRRQMWTETFVAKSQHLMRRQSSGQTTYSYAQTTVDALMQSSAFFMDVRNHERWSSTEVYFMDGVIGCCMCRSDEGTNYAKLNLSPGLLLNCINTWAKAYHYGNQDARNDDDICYRLVSTKQYTFTTGYIHFEIDYKSIEYYQRGYIEKMSPNIIIKIGNTEINPWNESPYHIETTLTGAISIVIRGGWSYPSEYFQDFIGLTYIIESMRLYWTLREETKTSSKEGENNYQIIINRNFTKSESINLEIGTDNNNKPSVSMVMDGNLAPITQYTIGASSIRPEIYLAGLMQKQYSNIQKTFLRTFRTNDLPATPAFPFTDGTLTYMAVIDKKQWEDDITILKFIQTAY